VRAWTYLLGGLLAWTVHFFGAYIIASVFLTSPTSRILTGLLTVLCLAASVLLAIAAWRNCGEAGDKFRGWMDWIAFLGAVFASVSILWQGLPAILI
jgi:hypothetical protein